MSPQTLAAVRQAVGPDGRILADPPAAGTDARRAWDALRYRYGASRVFPGYGRIESEILGN